MREYASTAMPPCGAVLTPTASMPRFGDVGLAADREHDAVGLDLAAVAERRGIARSVALLAPVDRRDDVPDDHLDAARLHFAAQMGAHVVVEPAQNVLAAIDQRHPRAEAGEDAGELDRDVAAALDHDLARQRRQVEGVVRRDGVLDARDGVPGKRRAAGGDRGCGRRAAAPPRRGGAPCGHPRSRRGS